jgi:hypothetical protein
LLREDKLWLTSRNYLDIHLEELRRTTKISVKVIGFPAEILTSDLSNYVIDITAYGRFQFHGRVYTYRRWYGVAVDVVLDWIFYLLTTLTDNSYLHTIIESSLIFTRLTNH